MTSTLFASCLQCMVQSIRWSDPVDVRVPEGTPHIPTHDVVEKPVCAR